MKGMERFASMRKRYGWGGLLRNASGKLLRLAGLNVSRWYMYAIPVAETDFNDLDRKLTGYPFKELCLEDFRRQTVLNPDWFTPAKMDDVERGLGIEGNHAYGLYEGELLVCYGWISLERFGLSEERLLPTDAYLWDAYTHPAFRGKRLHKYLSIMCLRSIAGYGKSRAVVIVANYNRASRQTYERSGYCLINKFWRYSLWKRPERTTTRYHQLPACTDVVVVGGSHNNTLWVARSLGMAGYCPTIVIVCDREKSFVTRSKYIRHSFVVRTDEEAVELLRSELRFKGKTVVFASSDGAAACLDRHFEELSERYCLFNCSGRQGELSRWMDKGTMVKQAAQSGFVIPRSTHVDLESVTGDIFRSTTFPCIVKPQKSSEGHKTDFRICNDKSSLEQAFSEIRPVCRYVQVQQYIRPDYEISVLCFRHRASGICAVPGLLRKLATCQSVSSLGMSTYAQVRKSLEPLVDENVVRRFLDTIDYHGLCSIEFFVKDGIPYFLEINLRVDGNLFIYTTAGCNMPRLFMELMQNPCYVPSKEQLRIDREVIGMTEVSFVKYTWKHPLLMLRVWWQTECYSIFSWKDPLPFLFKFIHP